MTKPKQAPPADRLRAFREAKGWTQGDLAIHLGASRSQIASVETGRRSLALRPAIRLAELSARWSGGQIKAKVWV